MVSMVNRINYWLSIRGLSGYFAINQDGDIEDWEIDIGQPTRPGLEAIPEADVEAWLITKAKNENVVIARADGSKALLQLTSPYSEEERVTWPTQEAEAREWIANSETMYEPEIPVIMIRRIAFHRGITMQVMVDKIMENVELFQYVAGDILGVQQKQIDDIETVE